MLAYFFPKEPAGAGITAPELASALGATDDEVAAFAVACDKGEAASLSSDELKAETLRHVNRLRMSWGWDSMYELPQGRPGTWKHCVLGLALGPEPAAQAIQNDPILGEFVVRFDRYEFPTLLDLNALLDHMGVTVGEADTLHVHGATTAATFSMTTEPDGTKKFTLQSTSELAPV